MAYKRGLLAIFALSIIGVIISPTILATTITQEIIEWKVEVGDTMEYTIAKYYHYEDFDGDGSKNTRKITAETLDGTDQVELTMKAGVKMKAYITTVTTDKINMSLIWENKGVWRYTFTNSKQVPKVIVTVPNYITKTTENQTYWEEYAKQETKNTTNEKYIPPEETPKVMSMQTVSIAGDEIEIQTMFRQPVPYEKLVSDRKSTWNWKTGWLLHYSEKTYNATGADEWTIDFLRTEYTYGTDVSVSTPSFEPVTLLVSYIILVSLFPRKKR